ncbi:MAG: hypothetical protein UU47_C0009G0001 [candidate division TM6 bacterium GW2011_GWE2_41_16]|nr:MAG: hypothetical protein UU47_C0009G0001 [candidate division TM6 bacterium GW2011_GWE2_41_16]
MLSQCAKKMIIAQLSSMRPRAYAYKEADFSNICVAYLMDPHRMRAPGR